MRGLIYIIMNFNPVCNSIALDMDGVLADFDKAATIMFNGMHPEVFESLYGDEKFWEVIHSDPYFFYNLSPMEDAFRLYNLVKARDLPQSIRVITGIPKNMDPDNNQKREWLKKWFPSITDIVCCRSRKKCDYCISGDILIDDRTTYKQNWQNEGGIYIVYKGYLQTERALKALKVI